nr:hypothetical protein [Ancylobacter mangrovi]
MFAAALKPLLAVVEHGGEDFLQPLGLKEALLDMTCHKGVEGLHRYGATRAAGFALPRFD